MTTRTSLVDRTLGQARRRMVRQLVLNKLAITLTASLALGLLWFALQPMAWPDLAENPRWGIPGGFVAIGLIAGIVLAFRVAPSPVAVALAVDERFDLRERITTASSLAPDQRDSAVGQAMLEDAESRIGEVRVKDGFPVRPTRRAWGVPAMAAAAIAAGLWWNPEALGLTASGTDDKPKPSEKDKSVANLPAKKPGTQAKPQGVQSPPRPNKSDKLKELEQELEKLHGKYDGDPKEETPEKQREKAAELAALEEKAKKAADQQAEKLRDLEDKFSKLEKLKKDPDFKGGPADDAVDALSKGDLKRAADEVDELRKKAKDKKLDEPEQKQLERQLDKLKSELERLQRDKDKDENQKEEEEKKDELKKEIEEKKKNGEDAEELERELDNLQKKQKQERAAEQELGDLASKLGRAKDALSEGDLDRLADELEKAKSQLEKVDGEVEDLKEAEEQLQKLREERRQAAQAGSGEKGEKGDKPGQGEKGDKGEQNGKQAAGQGQSQDGEPKAGPGGTGQGSGKRPLDPDAKTGTTEERVRSPFDPTGKKVYGGTTRGQGFKKKSETELGKEIEQSVQEAPAAADAQRLPRDARDAVKEYYEKLGGTGPKP